MQVALAVFGGMYNKFDRPQLAPHHPNCISSQITAKKSWPMLLSSSHLAKLCWQGSSQGASAQLGQSSAVTHPPTHLLAKQTYLQQHRAGCPQMASIHTYVSPLDACLQEAHQHDMTAATQACMSSMERFKKTRYRASSVCVCRSVRCAAYALKRCGASMSNMDATMRASMASPVGVALTAAASQHLLAHLLGL